jgi:hypothetical protein
VTNEVVRDTFRVLTNAIPSLNPMTDESTEPNKPTPKDVYQQRRDVLDGNLKDLEATDSRFATARGLVFLLGLFLGWGTVGQNSIDATWLLIPVGVFAALMFLHGRVARNIDLTRRAIKHYQRAIDRLEDRWIGVGFSGDRYRNGEHPYADDLDVFGDGSLFQLTCAARTRLGEDTLAEWLSMPGTIEQVKARQSAIKEIANDVQFREELALLDAEVHDEFDQNQLRHWVRESARPISLKQRIVATMLGVCAVLGVVAWAIGYGLAPFLIVVLFEILFFATVLREVRHIGAEADAAGSGLAILSQVLALLEQKSFEAKYLKDVRDSLETDGHPPAWQIGRLRNLIQSLNNSLQNQFFAPLAFLLGITIHVAHRVEVWRERIGSHIPDWLDAVGGTEAVVSLAGYAFEHPDDLFPELIEDSNASYLEAKQMGHPLIPADKCVRNDIRLDDKQRLIMISGSNMSGKSTLLRTIGINTVLALAGAPARAEFMKLSRLQVGSAMRVNDSLQQGASLFYQVISRIKLVVELANESPPLLFMLDEILQGTNSHDRRVGAEGIIRQLVKDGAIGLVTTHDLALTEIVASFDGAATNIHFEDHLINGKMYFDYCIRDGVVKKSNALELMRMIGLNVGNE